MAKDTYNVVRNEGLWPCGDKDRAAFIAEIWEEGGEFYRDFPWRGIDDPYAVLVSEVMLQQTQVARVMQYWQRFLDVFPTLVALSNASVADVLDLWQGLGYNRRALALKRAAETVAATETQELPRTFNELVALPGIGPATAAGIMAFAYQIPSVYIETNVRAVFIHKLFADAERITDSELIPYVADTVSEIDPRGWYYALLDIGAALKKSGINPTRASSAYTRQSAFEGSRRQKRAELIRIMLDARQGISFDEAHSALNNKETDQGRAAVDDELFSSLVEDLRREGFLHLDAGIISVAQ